MTIQNTFEILKNHFGERWSTSQTDLENHGHSESSFQPAPDAVVYPLTTADVVYIVNFVTNQNPNGYGVGTSRGIPLLYMVASV